MVMLPKQSKKESKQIEDVSEIQRRKVIANAEKKVKNNEWTKFLLRIKPEFLEQIDLLIDGEIGMNKTVWILEAIQEKIKREFKRKENV